VGDYIEREGDYFKIKEINSSSKTLILSSPVPGQTSSQIPFNYYGKIGAYGDYSHTEGVDTNALGKGSHAEGIGTLANDEGQHV
jgi:hypothetical protein